MAAERRPSHSKEALDLRVFDLGQWQTPRVTLPPIELLDTSVHDRSAFACGEQSLDDWLRQFASQAHKRDTAKTHVVHEGGVIVGYYSLCSFDLEADVLPKALRAGGYPVPAVLLARLAVDSSRQGDGLGGYLLLDALRVAALVADQIGARIMVVHALHDRAAQFYETYGFKRTETKPLTLYMPMQDIRATLVVAGLRERFS